MKDEVNSAAGFLARLLLARNIAPGTVENFRKTLTSLLFNHYRDHWFPDKPFKGSGYRCIRILYNKVDPIVEKATKACGLPVEALRSLFPQELTMWVDPKDVSYRIGENGSIGVLYANDTNSQSVDKPPEQQAASHSSSLHPEPSMATCGQQANHLHPQLHQYPKEMQMVLS